jgi:hypothetical protein
MKMRGTLIAIVMIATCAVASPPFASELKLPLGGVITTYTSPEAGGGIPKVVRGQLLGLACANVERAAADAVQVVMSLTSDEPSTGFTGVLATDQTITSGTVHVRVPDLPELAEHTVHVKVYVTDAQGMHSCDAGSVRIV